MVAHMRQKEGLATGNVAFGGGGELGREGACAGAGVRVSVGCADVGMGAPDRGCSGTW